MLARIRFLSMEPERLCAAAPRNAEWGNGTTKVYDRVSAVKPVPLSQSGHFGETLDISLLWS
jgi:hypothetical protein